MEYIPSYTDQLYHSYDWRDSLNNELYHYGVKGMKWGVRRYTNSAGNRVRKAGIGTATRVRQKQNMFRDKIKNSKIPKGSIRRNIVNTWREGRINELDYKAKHREAKRAYLKSGRSKESTKQLRKARMNRILNNGVAPYITDQIVPGGHWTTTTARGAYQRYKRKNK